MVRIRFQKVGRPHTPHFRLVVIDRRKSRDAACLEVLGHYHPQNTSDKITIDSDRLRYWLSTGAQPTGSASTVLKKAGLLATSES
ncbi:MAG TPA: 30S ribosomal protein S16 [Elusimicrobiota bacterium]|nr:30S ribosomal protein S16 [Elusimicrobiota bacterium]